LSPLNIALILFGPFVVVGAVALLAHLGTRLSEKDAETMRRVGEMQVRNLEGDQ
jgi:hypothetical protein